MRRRERQFTCAGSRDNRFLGEDGGETRQLRGDKLGGCACGEAVMEH